jgi:hypothetical protein
MAANDVPIDLYIAAYDDPSAAQADWDTIKDMVKERLTPSTGSCSSAAARTARSK